MASASLDDVANQLVSPKQKELIPDAIINGTPSKADVLKLLGSQPLQLNELLETLRLLEASCRQTSLYDEEDITGDIWRWTLDRIQPKRILADGGISTKDSATWTLIGHVAFQLLLNVVRDDLPTAAEVTIGQIATLIFWKVSDLQWISGEDHDTADRLLARALLEKARTVTKPKVTMQTLLLEEVVRPAFQRSRPNNITAAGRQAINTEAQALTASEDDKILKPWKFEQAYVVDILTWVIFNSDVQIVEDNWHIITPTILTLLDDEEVSNKVKGYHLLQRLLETAPSKLWIRTGLGKVFEDALMPALAYLPPVTEEADAEKLLKVLYPTLLSLCKRQYNSADQSAKRIKFLDNMLRAGVVSGLGFAGEHIRIATLLLDQLSLMLSEMGIQCVKHLKTIVPILVGYLSDAFAFVSPALLQSAIKAVQSVIVNAWPRMDHYCGELFKGITVCWHRLGEENDSEALRGVKQELKITMTLLRKALGDSSKVEEMETVIRKEETLRALAG